ATGIVSREAFSEMFRYHTWTTKYPDYEPVGLVLRAPGRPAVHDAEHLKLRSDNRRGTELPARFLAGALAAASNHFVLLSARVEKRRLPEFKFSGSSEEIVYKIRRTFTEHGLSVIPLGIDSFAVIETPGQEQEFSYDRSRA